MADNETCAPLTPESISHAYDRIKNHITRTPLLTSRDINRVASSPNPSQALSHSNVSHTLSTESPSLNLYFKCENLQRTGAFKARGAFNAISHLIDHLGLGCVRERGVVTASSGNHAQGLALAAATFNIPAAIVMPRSSTKSKIEGVATTLGISILEDEGGRGHKGEIIFCGSSNEEKKAAVEAAVASSGSIFVPPYEHPDIILGQGTCAKELEEQHAELRPDSSLDAVIAPLGGGGLLGGVATWFSDKSTKVFGAEPSFQGADDAVRGLEQGQRISKVTSSTIADGLRTPVGMLNWTIVSDPNLVNGVFSVSENEICLAMQILLAKLKIVVEPSACVPLAVVLFNDQFRRMVAAQQAGRSWDMAIVLSGGNVEMETLSEVCKTQLS